MRSAVGTVSDPTLRGRPVARDCSRAVIKGLVNLIDIIKMLRFKQLNFQWRKGASERGGEKSVSNNNGDEDGNRFSWEGKKELKIDGKGTLIQMGEPEK